MSRLIFRLFKGMGFTLEERQYLGAIFSCSINLVSHIIKLEFCFYTGIHGLLPPRVKSLAEQVDNCLRNRELLLNLFST